MRILGALVVAGAVGACGRIGFEPVGDGGPAADAMPDAATPIAEHACNTVMNLGMPMPLVGAPTGQWLTAAALPSGVVLAQSTTAGLSLFPIDFTQSPPVLGAAVTSPALGSNLQVAVSADRVMTSGTLAGGTQITITSTSLAPIVSRNEQALSVGAPDHAVADGSGGWVVASSENNTTRIDRITADGTFVRGGTWPLNNVRGASLAAAGPGRYVAVWDLIVLGSCVVRVVDEALVEVASTTIPSCRFIRVAATADRIGVSYYNGSTLDVITLSMDLSARSASQLLSTGHFSPSRTISAADGFWTVVPFTMTALHVNHASKQGVPEIERALDPYDSDAMSFLYDVVAVQGRAYAVWLSSETGSPSLLVERLCGS